MYKKIPDTSKARKAKYQIKRKKELSQTKIVAKKKKRKKENGGELEDNTVSSNNTDQHFFWTFSKEVLLPLAKMYPD